MSEGDSTVYAWGPLRKGPDSGRAVADGWQHGRVIDNGARWEPIAVGAAVTELLAEAPAPAPVYGAG